MSILVYICLIIVRVLSTPLSTYVYSFAYMDHKHHGAILESAMKSVGMTVSDLAREMKITRTTLYKRFETEVLDYFELIRFGQALGYDFSKDVPEIDMYKSRLSLAGEDSPELGNKKAVELEDCKKALGQYKDEAYKLAKELNTWKDKYIQVVEELAALRLKVNGQ